MGGCVSFDDCVGCSLCDGGLASRGYRPPTPYDSNVGFTFAAPADGTRLALGPDPNRHSTHHHHHHFRKGVISLHTAAHRGVSPSSLSPSRTPPTVPAIPVVVAQAEEEKNSSSVSDNDPLSSPQQGGQQTHTKTGNLSSGQSGSDNSSSKSREPFGNDGEDMKDRSNHHHHRHDQPSAGSDGKKQESGTSSASSRRLATTDDTITPARTIHVGGEGQNFVHLMAFTAQYFTPATHGPLLRFSIRNDCRASLAIGIVPLATASKLYGPYRYLYDWRAPEVGGGGITLWAREQAQAFGIFTLPKVAASASLLTSAFASKHKQEEAASGMDPTTTTGMCVEGSTVTLEVDLTTRVVRLQVEVPLATMAAAGTSNRATTISKIVREIIGSISFDVAIDLNAPWVFVVAPMCTGDMVTILP